jgi:hypothetical protein
MVHSGYEGSAVSDTLSHPLKALRVALKGPRTTGPMVDDPVYVPAPSPQHASRTAELIPLSDRSPSLAANTEPREERLVSGSQQI